MYYICIPLLNGCRLNDFIGYTDNYFLYRAYVGFLQSKGCTFAFDVMNYEDGFHCTNDDDFLYEASSIIQYTILYDSALRKITSDITDDFIVIPERVYDRFVERMYTSVEPRKILSKYVRLTSKTFIVPIMSYLDRDSQNTKDILEYIMTIRQRLDTILPYNEYSTRTMLAYCDGISTEKPILYSVFDEYSILLEYVITDMFYYSCYRDINQYNCM